MYTKTCTHNIQYRLYITISIFILYIQFVRANIHIATPWGYALFFPVLLCTLTEGSETQKMGHSS